MSENSEQAARDQIKSIVWLMGELHSNDNKEDESTIQKIYDYPLDCQMRSGWGRLPSEWEPEEYIILLQTGGPAVRLTGRLDSGRDPDTVRVEHQDWFETWTELKGLTDKEEEALLEFAQHFSFYAE